MKPHSRSRKALNEIAAYAIKHSAVDIPNQCQIIHQFMASGEVNLLDLPRLQTELERILAANTQRMTCIARHLRGDLMPEPVLRDLGLMEPDPANQPQHPLETARLKRAKSDDSFASCLKSSANPGNPLSIIISNLKDQPLESKAESQNVVQKNKAKAKSALQSMASSPIPSPCEIPNRFWALMEPYCAEITESNISYLEGILKSYVEEATTSKYFQIPQSKYPQDKDHISFKRKRRDASTKPEVGANSSDNAETSTNSSQFSEALKSATEMITLARRVDTQLKETKPASSSSVESLLGSLEKSLYDENVSSVLRRAVAHMAQGIDRSDGSANTTNREGVTENGSGSMVPTTTSDNLSAVCSQPLKNLARQLQVNSSFRVEKKIGQAIEELGLFPITLYLNHLSHRPDKPLLQFPGKIYSALPFPFHLGAPNNETSESSAATDSKSSLSNGLDKPAPPKDASSPDSPKSSRRAKSETAADARQKGPISAIQSNGFNSSQSDTKNNGSSEVGEGNASTRANSVIPADPSTTNEEEDTCPADAEIDGSNADTTDEIPSIPPVSLQTDYEETSDVLNDETLRPHQAENHNSTSAATKSDESISQGQDKKDVNLSDAVCNGGADVGFGEGREWFVGSVPQLSGIDEDEDFSNCILNLTSSSSKNTGGGSVIEAARGSSDQITLAIMRRQRELRQLCASNHNILHRLIQAARRDLQRQEIQRRLAIADADVLEAYNKLESYKTQKRAALKRDRDFAWKTLKERQKIRAELDAFDEKPP